MGTRREELGLVTPCIIKVFGIHESSSFVNIIDNGFYMNVIENIVG